MKGRKRGWFCIWGCMWLGALGVTTACKEHAPEQAHVEEVEDSTDSVERVVLLIADGMSLSHVAVWYTHQKGETLFTKPDAVGLQITTTADTLITDSGAAGTALATGQKTNYHMIGTSPDGKELTTLVDRAHAKGLGSAVISVCRLYDATPAAFCSHSVERDSLRTVCEGFVTSQAQVIIGGGRDLFSPQGDSTLLLQLQAEGYALPSSFEELALIDTGRVFALMAEHDLPEPAERGDYLLRATQEAMRIMGDKGYFIMTEASQIDDYGHANDLEGTLAEMEDLENTMAGLIQWAHSDPANLLIVTSDHETGGLTLVGGSLSTGHAEGRFSTGGHSGCLVPVYAYGHAAHHFTGVYHNAQLQQRIVQVMGL